MTTTEEDGFRKLDQQNFGFLDTDYSFLLCRLSAPQVGSIFRINVPDSVIFSRSEPFLKVYSIDPQNMILEIEREKDRLTMPEVQSFFKSRSDFEQKYQRRAEESAFFQSVSDPPERTPIFEGMLLILANRSQSSLRSPGPPELLFENDLLYFFNENKKTDKWKRLQSLVRVLQSDFGPTRAKFNYEAQLKTSPKELVKKAEQYILSFATVLPKSAKDYFSDSDDLKYSEVPAADQELKNGPNVRLLYDYFNFKIYFFVSLFYQINLEVFVSEYRFDSFRNVGPVHTALAARLPDLQEVLRREEPSLRASHQKQAQRVPGRPRQRQKHVQKGRLPDARRIRRKSHQKQAERPGVLVREERRRPAR